MHEGLLARRFELRGKLGEGGMGVVYRAWDRALGKEVALKRMRGVGAADVQTLKAEFRARSALQHKGIVQLYELVVDGEDCFLTMELVDGTDLASWVRGGERAGSDPGVSVGPLLAVDETASDLRRTVPGARGGRAQVTAPVGQVEAPAPAGANGHSGAPPEPLRPEAPPLDAAGAARLRAALAELCGALAVLHDAGIVHRDLTPSNVRVTPQGRVVVLDFGLAGQPGGRHRPGSDEMVIGTPLYMAPEQVRAERATPAADLYAVGTIVYELLSGRSPFVGSEPLVRFEKASNARVEPIWGTADDELAELALAMLEPDPAARPRARAVLARLAPGGEPVALAPTFGAGGPGACLGRAAELGRLRAALARVERERRPAAVIVEGPSGIGKSTLLRAFADEVAARRKDGGPLVLWSRCHPQESVPFKALDAAVDELAEIAATLGDLGRFAPAVAQAGLRLFPALALLPALAQAIAAPGPDPAAEREPRDDADVRAQGFEALRELGLRLTARAPMVLVIDDAQWDDSDSLALLEATLRGRGAPPVLLVLGVRTGSGESVIARRLREPHGFAPVEIVGLGPLGAADGERLAQTLLGDDDARVAGVVAQSEGNPFLLCELARYLVAHPAGARTEGVDVKGLVSARLGELEAGERALLDTVALAVRPLPPALALEAAGLGPGARTAALALRDAFLVRLGDDAIAPYHDKIAEATRELLAPARRAALHRGLAETIERHDPAQADALATHWQEAGEPARAAACAFRAAEHAAGALAFGRAAELYDLALALGHDAAPRAQLYELAARAHANAGRGATAEERYLAAARELGDDIASAGVRGLKHRAAEAYVKSGYVTQGWQVMRSVLDAAGVAQPATPKAAMVGALGRRLKFLLRRLDVDGIGERQLPEAERARLDILWTASTSMSMIDVTLSDAFRTMHLGRILEIGDASSIARALAYEAALEVHVGGALFDWHAGRLLDGARRLVARTGDAYDRAWLELGVANQAYCAGRWAEAAAACARSEAILRAECTGVSWELATVAAFHLTALAMLGDLAGLRDRAERAAADAEARGDLYALAEAQSGECVLAWWLGGTRAAEDALARASDAAARQGGQADGWPEKTYRRAQMTEMMGTVHLALLVGEPARAWKAMLAQWDALEGSMIPKLQFYRAWLRHGRARVALALAERGGREVDGWGKEKLLADARRLVKEMKQDPRPFAPPWAALVEGALAAQAGRRERAIEELEDAAGGFAAAEMALYREATRWRLGKLAGRPLMVEEAEAWMRAQGVPDVAALVGALLPGFGRLA